MLSPLLFSAARCAILQTKSERERVGEIDESRLPLLLQPPPPLSFTFWSEGRKMRKRGAHDGGSSSSSNQQSAMQKWDNSQQQQQKLRPLAVPTLLVQGWDSGRRGQAVERVEPSANEKGEMWMCWLANASQYSCSKVWGGGRNREWMEEKEGRQQPALSCPDDCRKMVAHALSNLDRYLLLLLLPSSSSSDSKISSSPSHFRLLLVSPCCWNCHTFLVA